MGVHYKDLIGQRFGRLVVVKKSNKKSEQDRYALWDCKCDCGGKKTVKAIYLTRGKVKSCGCFHKEEDFSGRRIDKITVLNIKKREFVRKGEHRRKRTYWLCRCDCGFEKFVPAQDLKIGRPKNCGRKECSAKEYKAPGFISKDGYRIRYVPNHSNSNPSGAIPEHILVMSNILGRPLLKDETVHHKNGVRDDNRIENLELWTKSHPYGQRVEDKIVWAKEILALYEPQIKIFCKEDS